MLTRILSLTVALLPLIGAIVGGVGGAKAQPVTVVGPVTPGNCVAFNSTTVIKDSGGPCPGGGLPIPTRAGDIIYWNGSAWVTLPGNNSGTNWLQENASGVPSWTVTGGANLTVGVTTVTGGASTGVLYNNSGVLGADAGLTWVPGGALTITPTTASYNRALSATQSGPVGGTTTVTAGVKYNFIAQTHNAIVTCTNNTNPFDDFGFWCNSVTGFRVNMTVGSNIGAGPGATGGTIIPVLGHVIHTSPTNTINDLVGVGGIAYSNSTNSGTSGLFGGGAAVVCEGCNWAQVTGFEIDIGFKNTPTAPIRSGLDIVAQNSTARGSSIDSAIWLVSSNGTGNFHRLVTLGGGPGLDTTGDLFVSDTATTIGNVFNFAGACSNASPGFGPCNVTVTGKILGFPNVSVAGSGISTFGAGTNSTGQIQLSPVGDSTSGGSNISVLNSAAAISAGTGTIVAMIANEPSRTTVRYGITLGNYAEIFAGNSAANGLIIGTKTNIPMIFGTNNTFAGSITGGQLWNFGPNVTPQANTKFTVNMGTAAPVAYTGGVKAPAQFIGVDGGNNLVLIDTFSTASASSFLVLRRARGTAGSGNFSAVQSGDGLGNIAFVGAFNTTTFAGETGGNGGGFISAAATENWSSTNQGTKITIFGTATTSGACASSCIAAAAVFQPGLVTLGNGITPLNTTVLVTNITTVVSGADPGGAGNALLQLVSNARTALQMQDFNAGNGSQIIVTHSRGSAAIPAQVVDGDQLFAFGAYANISTSSTPNYQLSGSIGFLQTAHADNSNVSGGIRFLTSNAGVLVFNWFAPSGGLILENNGAFSGTHDPGANGIYVAGKAVFADVTTASAANAFLDTGTAPANQLKRSTSSRRYKTGITAIGEREALQEIMALRGVRFTSLATGDDPGRRFIGLVAEEVAPIDEGLVTYLARDGQRLPDGVQYDRVAVLLLTVVQKLVHDNDDLRAEVNKLKRVKR